MRQIIVTNKLAVILAVAFSLLLIIQPAFAVGQTSISPPGGGQQGGEAEAKKLDELSKKADSLKQKVEKLPDEQAEKEAYSKRIDVVISTLEQINSDDAQIAEIQTQIEDAEKASNQLDETIKQFESSEPKDQDLSKLDVLGLRTRKTKVEAGVLDLRSEQASLQEAATSYQTQNEKLDQQLSTVAQELDDLGRTIANQIEPTSLPEKIASLEAVVQEQQKTKQRTLLTLQQQRLDTYKQFDMGQKRLELVNLQLARQETFAKKIDKKIGMLRQQEANDLETQAKNIEKKTTADFPELTKSEKINVELAHAIGELEKKASDATEDVRKLKLQYFEIESKFNKTVQTIALIKQSDTIGAMLRKRKAELPTALSREQRASDARDEMDAIQAIKFQDTEDLTELSIRTIREEVEEAMPGLTDERLDELFKPRKKAESGDKLTDQYSLVKPAEALIERRKELLRTRDKIYDRLFNAYVDIEANNNGVANIVDKFNNFISERILWLRSSKVLFSDLKIDKADYALVSVDKWGEVKEPALMSYQKRPFITCIGAFVLLMLLVLRSRMRREVDDLGQKAARGSCATFWPTSRAMVLTTLVAVTIPLIVYGIGWVLKQSTPSQSRLYDAIAMAFSTAGLFAIPFEILRRTCRPNGLAVKHFNWPGAAVAKLKFHLSWYILPATLIVFAVSLLDKLDPAHRNDLVERVLFIAGILLTALLFLPSPIANRRDFQPVPEAQRKFVGQTNQRHLDFGDRADSDLAGSVGLYRILLHRTESDLLSDRHLWLCGGVGNDAGVDSKIGNGPAASGVYRKCKTKTQVGN